MNVWHVANIKLTYMATNGWINNRHRLLLTHTQTHMHTMFHPNCTRESVCKMNENKN